MKVPPAVRAVFDTFPLVALPAHTQPAVLDDLQEEPVLHVYSVDEEGWPLDPRCLAAVGALILLNHKPEIKISSPYISSLESLPLLVKRGKKAVTTLDEMLDTYANGEELVLSPKLAAFKALVDTWLDDAWHASIMEAGNAKARDIIYGDTSDKYFPWPFSNLVASQLDEHLAIRHAHFKQGLGDDYNCSANNLHRTAMALNALQAEISAPLTGDPTLLDIMVFAYTWPITQIIPESALAALISPMLRQHAHEVRSYLINSGLSRSSSRSNF